MEEPAFRIVPVDQSNAGLVGEVFRAAYGDLFPVGYVYHAESLLHEIEEKRLSAAMALDADGRAAGYVSVFRSAPNPHLWEAGNLVVVPDFALTKVSGLLFASYANGALYSAAASHGLFGEAVCCHYYSQVVSIKVGACDCALELDQMDGPSAIGNRTGSARVTCVLNYQGQYAPPDVMHVPTAYAEILSLLLRPLPPRTLAPARAPLPLERLTRHEDRYYAPARTWKVSVAEMGADWPTFTADLLAEAQGRGVVSLQIILNMACPQIGAAVDHLRTRGFFFGGLVPCWFGSDGLLLQQVFGLKTEYQHIKLYSATAKELLACIRAERSATGALQ